MRIQWDFMVKLFEVLKTTAIVLTPVIALYLTNSIQENQIKIQEADVLEKYFKYISSEDSNQRKFGYVIFTTLGHEDLAKRFIAITNDSIGKKFFNNKNSNGSYFTTNFFKQNLKQTLKQDYGIIDNDEKAILQKKLINAQIDSIFITNPPRMDFKNYCEEHLINQDQIDSLYRKIFKENNLNKYYSVLHSMRNCHSKIADKKYEELINSSESLDLSTLDLIAFYFENYKHKYLIKKLENYITNHSNPIEAYDRVFNSMNMWDYSCESSSEVFNDSNFVNNLNDTFLNQFIKFYYPKPAAGYYGPKAHCFYNSLLYSRVESRRKELKNLN